MSIALAALFVLPAHADRDVAPDQPNPCEVWVQDSIPQRNAVDVPRNLAPVLFTYGGCDTAVRVEVIDDDGNVWLSQDELLAERSTIELEPLDWEPGAYAIRVVDTDRFVLDRIDFWIGTDEAAPAPDVDVALEAWSSGYETWVYASLDQPIDQGVIAITSDAGERAVAPAYQGTELVFAEPMEGERCFTVELRSASGDWSAPSEHCVEVYLESYDDDFVCGTGFPFLGCSNLGSSLPAGGLLLLTVAGTIRRRR